MNELIVPARAAVQPAPVLNTETSARPLFQLDLPESLGSVTEIIGGSGPSLIHIQEAHGNYEAQKSIAGILEHLNRERGIDALFLEGDALPLRQELLRLFPDNPELNAKVLDGLAAKGYVTGAELFMSGTDNVPVFGIENLSDYADNSAAFYRVLSAREKSETFLSDMDLQIKRLGAAYLSQDLRHFLERVEDFNARRVPLQEWIDYLGREAEKHAGLDLTSPVNQTAWPMLLRLFTLKRLEADMDAGALEKERAEFLKVIGKAPAEARDPVVKLLNAPLSGRQLAAPDTGLAFERIIPYFPDDFHAENYPNLNRFIGHLILRSELQSDRVMEEIKTLSGLIADTLSAAPEEKELVRLLRDYRLLKKAFALELSPAEYAAILERENAGRSLRPERLIPDFEQVNRGNRVKNISFQHVEDVDALFYKALDFYRGVKARDVSMLANIERGLKKTGAKTAVVITGGFHAKPFRDRFSSLGFNYALLTPRITDFSGQDTYVKTSLEHFLAPGESGVSTRRLPDFLMNSAGNLNRSGVDAAGVASNIQTFALGLLRLEGWRERDAAAALNASAYFSQPELQRRSDMRDKKESEDTNNSKAIRAKTELVESVLSEETVRELSEFADSVLARVLEKRSQETPSSLVVKTKGDEAPLTNIELELLKIVIGAVRERYPEHYVMSEYILPDEDSQQNALVADSAKGVWVVNALNGAQNYVDGDKNFGFSLAFYYEGRPVLGLVESPRFNGVIKAQQYEKDVTWNGNPVKRSPLAGSGKNLKAMVRGKTRLAVSVRDLIRYELREDAITNPDALVEYTPAAAVNLARLVAGSDRLNLLVHYRRLGSGPNLWDLAAGTYILEKAGLEAYGFRKHQMRTLLDIFHEDFQKSALSRRNRYYRFFAGTKAALDRFAGAIDNELREESARSTSIQAVQVDENPDQISDRIYEEERRGVFRNLQWSVFTALREAGAKPYKLTASDDGLVKSVSGKNIEEAVWSDLLEDSSGRVVPVISVPALVSGIRESEEKFFKRLFPELRNVTEIPGYTVGTYRQVLLDGEIAVKTAEGNFNPPDTQFNFLAMEFQHQRLSYGGTPFARPLAIVQYFRSEGGQPYYFLIEERGWDTAVEIRRAIRAGLIEKAEKIARDVGRLLRFFFDADRIPGQFDSFRGQDRHMMVVDDLSHRSGGTEQSRKTVPGLIAGYVQDDPQILSLYNFSEEKVLEVSERVKAAFDDGFDNPTNDAWWRALQRSLEKGQIVRSDFRNLSAEELLQNVRIGLNETPLWSPVSQALANGTASGGAEAFRSDLREGSNAENEENREKAGLAAEARNLYLALFPDKEAAWNVIEQTSGYSFGEIASASLGHFIRTDVLSQDVGLKTFAFMTALQEEKPEWEAAAAALYSQDPSISAWDEVRDVVYFALDGSDESNAFARLLGRYQGLVYLERENIQVPLAVQFFARPGESAASRLPFVDLASGANGRSYLVGPGASFERPIVLLDESPFAAGVLTAIAEKQGVEKDKVQILEGDLLQLAQLFKPNSVGTVMLRGVGQYVYLPDAWYEQLKSVVAPGGQVVLALRLGFYGISSISGEDLMNEVEQHYSPFAHTDLTVLNHLLQTLVTQGGWSVQWGAVNAAGEFLPGMSGGAEGEHYSETFFVFQKVRSDLRDGDALIRKDGVQKPAAAESLDEHIQRLGREGKVISVNYLAKYHERTFAETRQALERNGFVFYSPSEIGELYVYRPGFRSDLRDGFEDPDADKEISDLIRELLKRAMGPLDPYTEERVNVSGLVNDGVFLFEAKAMKYLEGLIEAALAGGEETVLLSGEPFKRKFGLKYIPTQKQIRTLIQLNNWDPTSEYILEPVEIDFSKRPEEVIDTYHIIKRSDLRENANALSIQKVLDDLWERAERLGRTRDVEVFPRELTPELEAAITRRADAGLIENDSDLYLLLSGIGLAGPGIYRYFLQKPVFSALPDDNAGIGEGVLPPYLQQEVINVSDLRQGGLSAREVIERTQALMRDTNFQLPVFFFGSMTEEDRDKLPYDVDLMTSASLYSGNVDEYSSFWQELRSNRMRGMQVNRNHVGAVVQYLYLAMAASASRYGQAYRITPDAVYKITLNLPGGLSARSDLREYAGGEDGFDQYEQEKENISRALERARNNLDQLNAKALVRDIGAVLANVRYDRLEEAAEGIAIIQESVNERLARVRQRSPDLDTLVKAAEVLPAAKRNLDFASGKLSELNRRSDLRVSVSRSLLAAGFLTAALLIEPNAYAQKFGADKMPAFEEAPAETLEPTIYPELMLPGKEPRKQYTLDELRDRLEKNIRAAAKLIPADENDDTVTPEFRKHIEALMGDAFDTRERFTEVVAENEIGEALKILQKEVAFRDNLERFVVPELRVIISDPEKWSGARQELDQTIKSAQFFIRIHAGDVLVRWISETLDLPYEDLVLQNNQMSEAVKKINEQTGKEIISRKEREWINLFRNERQKQQSPIEDLPKIDWRKPVADAGALPSAQVAARSDLRGTSPAEIAKGILTPEFRFFTRNYTGDLVPTRIAVDYGSTVFEAVAEELTIHFAREKSAPVLLSDRIESALSSGAFPFLSAFFASSADARRRIFDDLVGSYSASGGASALDTDDLAVMIVLLAKQPQLEYTVTVADMKEAEALLGALRESRAVKGLGLDLIAKLPDKGTRVKPIPRLANFTVDVVGPGAASFSSFMTQNLHSDMVPTGLVSPRRGVIDRMPVMKNYVPVLETSEGLHGQTLLLFASLLDQLTDDLLARYDSRMLLRFGQAAEILQELKSLKAILTSA